VSAGRERECVRAFMHAESEKGHASGRNETHENTVHSARTRRCHRPTRMAAAACGCLLTERCTTGSAAACSSCLTLAPAHHEVTVRGNVLIEDA